MSNRDNSPAVPALTLGEVYAVTARGQEELGGGTTTLSGVPLQLLVRIDGTLTLAQIKESMPEVRPDEFTGAWRDLRDGGLIVSRCKRFVLGADSGMAPLALPTDLGGADVAALSLRRSGYFVNIARPRERARAGAGAAPLSVVVVEDDPALARFIQCYLSLEGIAARLAANRLEVVAEFNRQPLPDLILLDVVLPDANGFGILQRLRQHAVLAQVPVIMLTAQATREAVLQGMSLGADGYVTKPFEADALMTAVRTVLGLPQPQVQPDPWAAHAR